ncbi:fimbrial protein [Serratia odorifera]|uniref:fimbrial protein n=1 Tax=Serratia odorifera TaxID=618 RepID=UPI003532552E
MVVNFKKTLLSGLMVASLAVVSGNVLANPVDVSVTFTGTILDNTCDTPTVTDSANNTVDFGRVSLSNFGTAIGTEAAEEEFSLSFTNCGASAEDVNITFRGTAAADNISLDNVSGTAAGVGVKVYGGPATDTELTINTAAMGEYTSLSSGTGPHLVPLKAKLVRTTEGAVTAGTLDTQGILVVHYP